MDRESLWGRRTSSGRTSLSLQSSTDRRDGKNGTTTKGFTPKRFPSSDSRSALNGVTPLNTNTTSSPGASSAFGLGSGAFASFGSASKTPKTPGSAFEFAKHTATGTSPPTEDEKPPKPELSSLSRHASKDQLSNLADQKSWLLKYTWVMWYRPPTSKNQDYEKSIKPVCKMSTAQEFWKIYVHLKRPSGLPIVSDYHFFKDGIRPVWEDDANKKGGKWIMRLKKGVIDRYWEDMLLAVIGDQFMEAGEEVCGMVVSVRNGEDVLSVWTKNDGGRNVKIRETIKRVLTLPSDTNIIFKSHDDSIAQRSAIEQARQDKSSSEKRRNTMSDNTQSGKEKFTA